MEPALRCTYEVTKRGLLEYISDLFSSRSHAGRAEPRTKIKIQDKDLNQHLASSKI